ncbi:MAG: tetratricopeptide repeat protein [candidate division Zixibacteria bacterium]
MKRLCVILAVLFFIIGCQSKTVVIKSRPVETEQGTIKRGQKISSDNHLIQGKKFYTAGKYKQASKHFIRAISKNKDNWEAHYYLGLTLQKQGRFDQAIGSFKYSQKYAPKDNLIRSRICYSLALSWENEGYFARAGELYTQVLSLNPKHAKAKAGIERTKLKSAKANKKKKKNPKAF